MEESAGVIGGRENSGRAEEVCVMHKKIHTFSLVQSTQLSGKLSRLKNKHVRKNVHASRLNANGM